MMSMSKLCIICHQWSSPLGEDQPTSTDVDGEENESLTKVEVKMKIFFDVLISHLNLDEDESEDDGGGVPELMKRAIEGGLLCCGDCLKTVDSFVKLYRQLKTIEGRLNSKLKKLTNVMFHAHQAGSSKLKGFRKYVTEGLNMEEEVANEIILLKRSIVKKGRKLLKQANSNQSPEGHEDLGESSSKNMTGDNFDELQPPSPDRRGSEDEWLLPNTPPDVDVKNEMESSENEGEASDIFIRDHYSSSDEPEQTVEFEEESPTNDHVLSPTAIPDVNDSDDDNDNPGSTSTDLVGDDSFFIIQSSTGASQSPIQRPTASACKDPNSKLYHCPHCPTQLRNRYALETHLQVEHFQIKFGCTKCLQEFTRKSAVQRHYKHVHMNIRNFKCGKCGRTFTRKCYLDAHQPQNCDGVLTKTQRSSDVRKPREKTKPVDDNQVDREYPCRRCQQVFKSYVEHRRHVKEAHPKSQEGPGVCDLCGKGFQTSERLGFHISTVHCKIKRFVCETCGSEFKRRDNLNDHRKRIHLGIRTPRASRSRKKAVKRTLKGNANDQNQNTSTNDKEVAAATPTESLPENLP